MAAPGRFAALMAPFAPFEPRPHLAAGVSGGPDSLALALLLHEWASAQGGQVTALTVDHGLRPGSEAEARRVGGWLAARGIAQVVLPWRGEKPATGIQAAARSARRRLLGGWCAAAGVLHLALAHQRDDQAETCWLRAEHGSGPDGLAGMAMQVEAGWGRVIRPLLPVPRAELAATLAARGQAWVEDPANRDPRFRRSLAREALAESGQAAALAAAAAESGQARRRAEQETARWLARTATIDPAGTVTLDRAALAAAPPPIRRRIVARALMTVGGLAHAPRGARLDRLVATVAAGGPVRPRTLGGCLIRPVGEVLWLSREPGAPTSNPPPGNPREFRGFGADAAATDLDGVVGRDHLIHRRRDARLDSVGIPSARFRPDHPLAGPAFAAVPVEGT